MKIKLFENFEEDEFIKCVKNCFSELIDDELACIDTDDGSVLVWIDIKTDYESGDINKFFQSKEEEMSILRDIKGALERIKSVYDIDYDVDHEFDIKDDEYQILLILDPGIPKEGDFYKEKKYGIKIDYTKLRETLNLPNNLKISTWTGRDTEIEFIFPNSDELDKYKDKLIKDLLNLKVGEIYLVINKTPKKNEPPYKIFKNYERTIYRDGIRGVETINGIRFVVNDQINLLN